MAVSGEIRFQCHSENYKDIYIYSQSQICRHPLHFDRVSYWSNNIRTLSVKSGSVCVCYFHVVCLHGLVLFLTWSLRHDVHKHTRDWMDKRWTNAKLPKRTSSSDINWQCIPFLYARASLSGTVGNGSCQWFIWWTKPHWDSITAPHRWKGVDNAFAWDLKKTTLRK